jgi:precorrin-6B methylase 2
MDTRFESLLRTADPGFQKVVERIPLQSTPPLPPEWLRCEMLERYQVLLSLRIRSGARVLEVGSGGHAIATIPLAHLVGPRGEVLALERARWGQFRELVSASGLSERIDPIAADARRLPLRDGAVDLAVCVHGVRSLGDDAQLLAVVREMLRSAPRVALVETLPVAHTAAQRAHLAMYGLREEVLRGTTGRADDLPYRPLEELVGLVRRAGGEIQDAWSMEVDLPHALAYFPRSLAESAAAGPEREALLRRWDDANAGLETEGADHPPVGVVVARRP